MHMATRSTVIRRPRSTSQSSAPAASPLSPLALAAPVTAVLAGVAAEWLDFRALRYPLLAMVLTGVLVTAWARFASGRNARTFVLTLLLGMATWAAAESLYVVLHVAQGERFDADRFGPQWAQALGLIGVHGLFLGAPTGLAAALLLHARPAWRRLRRA